jgi:hypothetical protein
MKAHAAVMERRRAAEALLAEVTKKDYGLEQGLKAAFPLENFLPPWWFTVRRKIDDCADD